MLLNPQVSISIANFGSKFVSVLGAVNTPGVRTIDGPKTLSEMLSASGGLRASIRLKDIMNATNAAEDISILPGDTSRLRKPTSCMQSARSFGRAVFR